MKKMLVVLAAVILSGCTTTQNGNQVRTGIDLLSIGSYKVRGWVPSTPGVRQVCAAVDYYAYSWENTPFQNLFAHAAVLFGGEKQGWWDILPDEWTGDDEQAPLAPLPGATLRTTIDGSGNTVTYVYVPGQNPVLDLSMSGDGNTVTVQPMEEEEEEE